MTCCAHPPSKTVFVLFPAIAVSLGWGLRGYIGGGPFAAMIPGAFVALSLSLLLRHDTRTAATVALFGALGIGYGGDMTYGQTLGLATQSGTMGWGLLGVTVKGAVWGLLGGAVLGAGLTRDRYQQRTLNLAFLLTIVAFYLGWKLVNEPRLIYFSDPMHKPREESWAGLLFAAAAFLGFLRGQGTGPGAGVPLRFALWGAVGGALGFGGGTLWLVCGPSLPVSQKWFGWWKMMEFTFGFLLGAALGLAGWCFRNQPAVARSEDEPQRQPQWPVWLLVAFVAIIFIGVDPLTASQLKPDAGPVWAFVTKDLLRLLGSFIFFGAICFALGLRSRAAAWQIAITLTFFHTVLDLVEDMGGENPGQGFRLPGWVNLALLLGSTSIMGLAVWRVTAGPRVISRLYLLLVWACYAVATVRTFVRKDVLAPAASAPGGIHFLFAEHPAGMVVQTIFTAFALLTTWYVIGFDRTAPPCAGADRAARTPQP